MKKIAIWMVTPNGVKSALKIAHAMPEADLYCTESMVNCFKQSEYKPHVFKRLSQEVEQSFNQYEGHVFIMSTGIAVRVIAAHLKSKVTDPAVTVLDDRAIHCISLLSGHLGGANALTQEISVLTGARAVITTATDINRVPAIDIISGKKTLFIENTRLIKRINMAFLMGDTVFVDDPYSIIKDDISGFNTVFKDKLSLSKREPSVHVDYKIKNVSRETLVLRPPLLTVGIGCNRNTPMEEINAFFIKVFKRFEISPNSVFALASIDIKNDETGLIGFAAQKDIPINYYGRDELNTVETIKTPSPMAEKYTGARSVCEAAAILAAGRGELIVPKQVLGNVTLAVARRKTPSILLE